MRKEGKEEGEGRRGTKEKGEEKGRNEGGRRAKGRVWVFGPFFFLLFSILNAKSRVSDLGQESRNPGHVSEPDQQQYPEEKGSHPVEASSHVVGYELRSMIYRK